VQQKIISPTSHDGEAALYVVSMYFDAGEKVLQVTISISYSLLNISLFCYKKFVAVVNAAFTMTS
jgi:hypothetical protein